MAGTQHYYVLRDGRIIFLKATEKAVDLFVVVENWFEELKRFGASQEGLTCPQNTLQLQALPYLCRSPVSVSLI